MIDESNPAGRLHKLLSEARKSPEGHKTRTVWANVIGCEDEDVAVTKAVVSIYSLSQETQTLIKMIDSLNHDLYLSSFKQLDRAFFPLNLGQPWKGPKQNLTDEAMTRLQFCAEELAKLYKEESLSSEDLDSIVAKTEELFELLYKSDLPLEVRLILLEEIERIRSAITMYKIKGAKGLKEALQSTLGAVLANHSEIKSLNDGNSDILKRLGELIDKLDSFTSRALKVKRIIQKPVSYLLEKIINDDKNDSE